jgi:hypothetical protein
LVEKCRDGVHWSVKILNSQAEIFEIIAGAFRDAAQIKQAIPQNAPNMMNDLGFLSLYSHIQSIVVYLLYFESINTREKDNQLG